MAIRLFRKRPAETAEPAIEPKIITVPTDPALPEPDPARDILELLELELGGLVRQLEKAAGSVAGGAESTAATLTAIRDRTDALTQRSTGAQATATTFAHAA